MTPGNGLLALRAARLFDGERFADRPLVLVEDGRVRDVDTSGAAPPERAELVDLGDATLLPGLIDSHAHLALDASTDPLGHLVGLADDALLGQVQAAAARALSAGITTVRDVGDRRFLALEARERARRDPRAGADVVAAGPPLTSPGGHCAVLGGEVRGVRAVRGAVRERAERGADLVKVMVSGGHLTAGSDVRSLQFDAEELQALVDEAHAHGLPVAAHAHPAESITAALAAGVDTVEHATFSNGTHVQEDPVVLDALAASGVPVTVALGAVPGATLPPPRILALIPQFEGVVRDLVAAGVPLVPGPDAGIAPGKPHDVLPHALVHLGGFLPLPQVLVAATSRAAQVCRVADRTGRVAPGLDADLLAVPGDVAADLSAVTRPLGVWHRGVRVR